MKLSNRIVLFNDENLKGDVNSAAKDMQTIYIQAVSGTLSVNAPNTWVGVSDESVSGTPPNATAGQTPHWTTKKPTYQSNYPIIFVAEQRRGVDGNVTCSTPVKDDTTTIIDGGHITTGTIDASVVNVTNINANNINSGKVKAEYIETSRITIGQSQVNGLDTALAGKQPTGDYSTRSEAQGYASEAANKALYYITEDETDGIKIHDRENVDSNYAQIDSSGMKIYKGGVSVAEYSDTARIGKETGTNTNLVATSSGINFRSGTTPFGQIGAYDSTVLGATMQNLKLASEPSANSYGRIKLSASSASGTGIPSEAGLGAKKGSAEAGVYVTADQDSGGDHADVLILGQNIALHVGYGDDYIRVLNGSSTTVATLGTNGNMALEGYLTVGGHRAIDRNYICYANSRVDNFVDGQITLSLETLGITTGAKPVGVIVTYQDGGATPTILRYDYDASSSSGVVIKAYNSSGGAVSGNVRYFAVVFQNTWASA